MILSETVHIYLLDEGSCAWRPTRGIRLADMIYMILPTDNYDPEDENWEFKPGEVVVCKNVKRYDEEHITAFNIPEDNLIAYKIADWKTNHSNAEDVIYINILDDRPGGWRPTKGLKLDEMIYKVLPIDYYDRAKEDWEFKPGSIVECKRVILPSNKTILIAYKLAESDGE